MQNTAHWAGFCGGGWIHGGTQVGGGGATGCGIASGIGPGNGPSDCPAAKPGSGVLIWLATSVRSISGLSDNGSVAG